MDAYDADQQLEQLKRWWNSYGNALIGGVLLGLALLGGYNFWSHHRAQQSTAASTLYDTMLQSLAQNDSQAAQLDGQKIISSYRSTPYAGEAALILARINFDAGNVDAASKNLQWAIDNATDGSVRLVARLRLARLQIQDGKLDAALALADVKNPEGFASEFAELRGDVLAAKGQKDAAAQAYRSALESIGRGSAYARVLQMKLDNLGVEAGK